MPRVKGVYPAAFSAGVYAAMIAFMVKKGAYGFTYAQVAKHTGCSRQTVLAYVNALHDAKVIHLARKLKDSSGKASIKQFVWGAGEDIGSLTKTSNEYKKIRREKRKIQAKIGAASPLNTAPNSVFDLAAFQMRSESLT